VSTKAEDEPVRRPHRQKSSSIIVTETLVVVHDAVPARPVEPVRDRVKIAAAGGIPPLIARLSSQSTGTQERAVNALGNLSLNVKNRGTIAAVAVFDLCHKYILYLYLYLYLFATRRLRVLIASPSVRVHDLAAAAALLDLGVTQ
jgi:hypothetical protein